MIDPHISTSLITTHPESFVHLNVHTQYSLLSGAITTGELVSKCQELGLPAIAQTDYSNMFGAIDFYSRCKAAEIKPILGSQVYFEFNQEVFRLGILCKNNLGYQNLCKLISKTYEHEVKSHPCATLDMIREFSDGLICINSRLHENIQELANIFGKDFYLELIDGGSEEQEEQNKNLIAYAEENNLQLVATNNVHYQSCDDARAQKVLTCIADGKVYDDQDDNQEGEESSQKSKKESDQYYLKSPTEMRELFAHIPEACDNTLRIADKCNVDLRWKDKDGNQIYHLPDFPIETGENERAYFMRMAREGLEKRFTGPHFKKIVARDDWEDVVKPHYTARLEEELGMVVKMDFAGYFLIVFDFIKWSKNNSIPVGPGRGSGAGSLVAYALEITNINPLPYNLLFERFINPERITMPDFDIDFCQNGRAKVIEYVTEKYGENNVGQIITFGKLQARAAIKDVSRVFGLKFSEADMISKLIPDELGINLKKALEKEPKLTELIESDPKIRHIFSVAMKLEGLYRHAGIHAAGIIITSKPLVQYCPLFKGAKGEKVVQYDKDYAEMIGLVKFDFLGLKTLTVIDQCCQIICRDYDSNFDIEEIDLEDRVVYDFISQGETVGVFQLESSGMTDLCKRIKPESIDDITAINALYRPGPLESGMVDDFINRKHGREKITYSFSDLEPILKETYGTIVYQEQVMNVARVIAGYSMGQADMLRRAMGKKKVDEMEKHRAIFVQGAKKKGFDEHKARELFQLMEKFAAYGFCKSHAVVYALISYQTAYLKKYYPVPFYAAQLSTEMSNTEKLKLYLNDARAMNVRILPPDINYSAWGFSVIDGEIRFGLGAIKGVGEIATNNLVSERNKNGHYKDFIDFCLRNDLRLANKRMLEALIMSGAFDRLEKMNRKTLLENLEEFQNYAEKRQNETSLGQGTLFSSDLSGAQLLRNSLNINDQDDFDESEKLKCELALTGTYISGHPLDGYVDVIKRLGGIRISEVYKMPKLIHNDAREKRRDWDRRRCTLSGLIISKRVIQTKKGDKMLFATLEDTTSKIELVVFPKVYQEFQDLFYVDEPLIVDGYIKTGEEDRKFFPEEIKKLSSYVRERVTGIKINVSLDDMNDERLEQFKKTLESHEGSVATRVVFEYHGGQAQMKLGEDFGLVPTATMAAKVNRLFNRNCVQFIMSHEDRHSAT